MADMDVDYASENSSPIAKPSKAKASKGASSKVALAPHNAKKGGKSIEETYQKLSQLEHILLRPDTYIGSTEKQQQQLWVHNGERVVLTNVTFAPGLYKIFDEILVNAADNKVRDSSMDTLRVDIDEKTGEIKVLNNGAGVPVEVHKEEGIYVPELIFGHLLTSSNYNDNEKKVTGGRNGYGAKLANIFSKKFVVETCDGKRKRRYKQTFKQNMTNKGEPVITDCKPSENWTCITFQPDLERFGMEELEEDTVALMRKRVYDMAGILGKTVKVYYNGQRVPVKDFQSYVDLYLGPKDGGPARIYERINDRWEVCISMSEGQFNQVSFVNSICTSKGGTHVNYVADQVVKNLVEMMNKKNKQAAVKPFMVKNYLWVFVNCLIENPAFDSQTKDTLTLRASSFGSKCELSDQYLKKVANCGVVDAILSFANFKANKELKKGDGAKRQRLVGIPKLDDANDAGGKNSEQCTLILTEGDSAKSLAISGLSVVGRDKFGVFPLRGKLLNVRDASAAQITGNAEIQNIKQILGLQHGKVYTDTKSLRYGHLMIMTDQDHDGSHIKGLIMNYLHHFYPSLLKIPGFLVEFITPIIKATKGRESISFYTLPEYETWRENIVNPRGWKIKYYKGLGTSTAGEAKEYFANIQSHRKQFVWEGQEDGSSIEMAFSKKKVEERKEWLKSFVPGTFLDHSADTISYHEFVHKELILFSRADLERSIPNMVDGFKPGQRKIMYACFKRNLKNDIKVAQLAGYVAEHSAYHHGEASLASTIVGLAQEFVGSNNINLLVPQGQFGTRLQGGKDAASPRYIFTRLAELTRHLFNEADDKLLTYLNEEGQSIEPEYYMPIIPLVLVNGAEGIGTGWSTSIPNYNPMDLVNNLKRMLEGEEPEPMTPWYRGFKGVIQEAPSRSSSRSYQICGVAAQIDDGTLEISELPVRKWTQDYKEFLEEMVKPEDKNATPFITDYKEHHTDANVRFMVTMPEAKMREALAGGLYQKFKLTTKVSTSNMMLFDQNGVIKKYESPEDILKEFFHLRMSFYVKRRAALLKAANAELVRIDNKVRFILAVINGSLKLSNRKRSDVESDLEAQGFDRLPSLKKQQQQAIAEIEDPEEVVDTGSYEYLLSMSLSSLTKEKVEALQEDAAERRAEVDRLNATTEAQMWRDDLDAFAEAYVEFEEEHERREAHLARQQAKAAKAQAKQTKAGKGKGKKKKNEWSDDESDFSDSEDDYSDYEKPKKKPAAKKKAAPAVSASLAPAGRVIPAPLPPPAPTASQATRGPRKAAGTKEPKQPKEPKAKKEPKVKAIVEEEEPAPPAEEEMSLMQRMAARMGGLAIDVVVPPLVGASKKPAAIAPKRAAAKKAVTKYVDSDSETEEEDDESDVVEYSDESSGEEVDSPFPPPRAAVSKPAARAPSNLSGKRKPAPLKKSTKEDSDDEMDLSGEAPSPIVSKPLPKVQRIRPSPFHKGSGKPAAAKKTVAAKKKKEESESDFDVSDIDDASDVEDAMSPAAPRAVVPRRAVAAATTKPKYAESDDESEPESESEEEDDYCPSD